MDVGSERESSHQYYGRDVLVLFLAVESYYRAVECINADGVMALSR